MYGNIPCEIASASFIKTSYHMGTYRCEMPFIVIGYDDYQNCMASTCPLCNKGSRVVGKYSNRVRATKFNPCGDRRVYPNLQWARIPNGPRIKICTSCIKKGLHLQIKK